MEKTKIDLLSAIHYMIEAWSNVTETTIKNCWISTCIVPAPIAATLKSCNEPRLKSKFDELASMISKLELCDPMDAEEYVNEDFYDHEPQPDDLPDMNDKDESDDGEIEILTHREVLAAMSRIKFYMLCHPSVYSSHQIAAIYTITCQCRQAMHSTMKQSVLDDYFTASNTST